MRLDKLLEHQQYGSRKTIKRLIQAQKVTVDGEIVNNPSRIVDSGLQDIRVEGRKLPSCGHSYLMLYKPKGVVSAVSDKEHQTVLDLLSDKDRKEGLYPIGRLDRDTEGLLLLTNNGPLGFRMLHPKHHVTKTYYVDVNGYLGADAITFFERGIIFHDGTQCQAAKLELIKASKMFSSAYVTISEGKFHQVKKMFLAYGVKVIGLKRLRFGAFELDNRLKAGEYRHFLDNERQLVKQYLD